MLPCLCSSHCQFYSVLSILSSHCYVQFRSVSFIDSNSTQFSIQLVIDPGSLFCFRLHRFPASCSELSIPCFQFSSTIVLSVSFSLSQCTLYPFPFLHWPWRQFVHFNQSRFVFNHIHSRCPTLPLCPLLCGQSVGMRGEKG